MHTAPEECLLYANGAVCFYKYGPGTYLTSSSLNLKFFKIITNLGPYGPGP